MAAKCKVLVKDKLMLNESSPVGTAVTFLYSIDVDGIFRIKAQQSNGGQICELEVNTNNLNLPTEKL